MKGKIEFIRSSQIDESLKVINRQYLLGNLKRPQKLDYIFDSNVEIGITKYSKNESEKGHYHTKATEYHLVISGFTKYLDLETFQEYEFRKGDFYVIRPDTKYGQKSKKGTEILFIKVPSGDDKTGVLESERILNWLDEKISTVRIDHFYSKDAPVANSIRPAVAVAIIDDDKLLMIKRKDSGNWTMVGGTHELGEDLVQTGIREVKEEVGFEIKIDTLIATYTDPNVLIEYNDGEVRQEFTFLYLGHILGGNLQIDDESTDAQWVKISEAIDLPMALSQRRRVEDLIKFLNEGQVILK